MAAVNYDMKSKSNSLMLILPSVRPNPFKNTKGRRIYETQNEPLSLLNNNVKKT